MSRRACALIFSVILLLPALGCGEAASDGTLTKRMEDSLYEETDAYSREYYAFDDETGMLELSRADRETVMSSRYTDLNKGTLDGFSQQDIEAVISFSQLVYLMERRDLYEPGGLRGGDGFKIERVSEVIYNGADSYIYAVCVIPPFGRTVVYALDDGRGEGNHVWAYCGEYDMATFEDVDDIRLLSNSLKDDLTWLCAAQLDRNTFLTSYIFTDDGRTAILGYLGCLLEEDPEGAYCVCYSKALMRFSMLEHLKAEHLPQRILEDN